jgi:hypothetical protein
MTVKELIEKLQEMPQEMPQDMNVVIVGFAWIDHDIADIEYVKNDGQHIELRSGYF